MLSLCYTVLKCDIIKFPPPFFFFFFFFLSFGIFMTICKLNMMKNPHTPNLTWICSWCPEIQNSYEPDQFTLISIGLIRYSCGHISGLHETIPTKWTVDAFHHASPIWYRGWYPKRWNVKKKGVFFVTSLLYSIVETIHTHNFLSS